MTKFTDLGLSEPLLRAIEEKGYTEPSPIQAQAIPAILDQRDVLAAAQTGTGKTAGFTLPLLQLLGTEEPIASLPIRALIITPTRELAAQIHESVRTYGKYLHLRSDVVFGGVSIVPQKKSLKKGVDILVATPGRLLDLHSQRIIDLSRLQILVLDEADRMLDMGFIHDIKKILKVIPAKRQNLLFSATFSDEIREVSSNILNDPVLVEVAARNSTADKVEQEVYMVDPKPKPNLLIHLIKEGDWQQVLVFTRTKYKANNLAKKMCSKGIEAAAIHGDKSQNARTRALADFKAGRVRVLVATDIAARGLDIEQLPHVVNFELPNVPEDYVHRIGRTARAGQSGHAVSLVCPNESKLLGGIERLLNVVFDKNMAEGFELDPDLPMEPLPVPGRGGGNRGGGGRRGGSGGGGRSSRGPRRDKRGASDQSGGKSSSAGRRNKPQRNSGDGDGAAGEDGPKKFRGVAHASKAKKKKRQDDRQSEEKKPRQGQRQGGPRKSGGGGPSARNLGIFS